MSLAWPNVRDNHLVLWNGGNWTTDPDFPVSTFSAAQQAKPPAAIVDASLT